VENAIAGALNGLNHHHHSLLSNARIDEKTANTKKEKEEEIKKNRTVQVHTLHNYYNYRPIINNEIAWPSTLFTNNGHNSVINKQT